MNDRAALRPTPTEADRVGFFGKVPSHGDFVSTGIARDLQAAFDSWLQSGLQRLQQIFPADWEARFKAMPTWRFVIERGHWGAATLAGVILPSFDRVGRSFPLVIVAPIPGFTDDPRRLCLDDSWFTAAEGMAESAGRGDFDIKGFIAGLKRLRSPHPGDLETDNGKPLTGSFWWRQGDDRKLIGFRNTGAPQPDDLLRLLEDGTAAAPAKPAATPHPGVSPVPAATAPEAPAAPRVETSVVVRPLPRREPYTQLRVSYSVVSHPGTRLSVNADCLLTEQKRGLFAVADGIGDGATAAEAARIAIAALDEMTPQASMDEVVQSLKGKLGRAHGLIQATKMSFERDAPGASIAVLAIQDQGFALVWAGDVRCYVTRDGTMRCISRDHLEIGLKRGLSRYLGRPGQLSPDVFMDGLKPGDRLLLVSNPLCRVLPERSIAEIVNSSDIDMAAAVLGQEALIAACRENFSAIVIEVSA